ncbi:hypothetical protein GCM10025777_15090 [Membranihabitans marinus]
MENNMKIRFLLFMVAISISSINAEIVNTIARDTVPIPKLVVPDVDGSFTLHAADGAAIGPNIKYMPEWMAYGWFTSEDRVEWDVDVQLDATYEVFLEWSVSDEGAGNLYKLEAETGSLLGHVRRSGSWYTFRLMSIGELKLEKGQQKIVLKGVNDTIKEGLFDLRALRFLPIIPYED